MVNVGALTKKMALILAIAGLCEKHAVETKRKGKIKRRKEM